MLRAVAGTTNEVRVRVFNVENRGSTVRHFRADRGKSFTAAGVQAMLDAIVEDLDLRFPADEFDLVQVGAFAWNVVWRGKRQPPAVAV